MILKVMVAEYCGCTIWTGYLAARFTNSRLNGVIFSVSLSPAFLSQETPGADESNSL